MTWDQSFDLIVVGSGAAGMSAAIRAHDLGRRVLIVEATDQYGGSTAISGGVVWIPDNPQLPSRGIKDSREDSLTYLKHITQGEVPVARLEAYVDESKRVLAYLDENAHFKLDALEEYADYYPEAPGGKPGGRSMEPVPYDATLLGSEFLKLRKSHPQSQIMGLFGITAREAKGYLVPGFWGTVKLLSRFVQYGLRWFKRRRFHRDTKLHAGNALIARLRRGLMDRNVPLWLSTELTELVIEGGRVTGVVVKQGDKSMRLAANDGVMLAAGGFERNQAMREQYQRAPISTDWNAGNLRNQGDAIRLGADAGGALALMDEAWWTPVTRLPKSDSAWVLVVEKSLPGGLFVNRAGKRFYNEAAPYLDVGKAMWDGDAVPDAWLVFDGKFRRDFPVGPIAPGYAQPDSSLSRRLREDFLTRADTLDALAEKCGFDVNGFRETIARFNTMATAGVDEDYRRGDSANDRYYADDRIKPNPSLRALTKAPFYAIRIYPGDLGTKGGLVTDRNARVLDASGAAIPGLYAAGNTSAAVMGRTYPGAGGTIGPALVFGFLGAEAAAADGIAQGPSRQLAGGS
jgi:3-oxosteroid 1-dehydrogenase